jgi:hypothetical protein
MTLRAVLNMTPLTGLTEVPPVGSMVSKSAWSSAELRDDCNNNSASPQVVPLRMQTQTWTSGEMVSNILCTERCCYSCQTKVCRTTVEDIRTQTAFLPRVEQLAGSQRSGLHVPSGFSGPENSRDRTPKAWACPDMDIWGDGQQSPMHRKMLL